jgi:hypothetical protein
LYRDLFTTTNRIVNLPTFLTNSPSNVLINDIKAGFLFVDPISASNEFSRDIYFMSLSFFNFSIFKAFLLSCGSTLNIGILNDYIIPFFFDSLNTYNSNNFELYKSQYRPMRKGITNMIRLHATGAIAMPIEIRLQILASSKDVIHS